MDVDPFLSAAACRVRRRGDSLHPFGGAAAMIALLLLLALLDSSDYRLRAKATRCIRPLIPILKPHLEHLETTHPSMEVRRRCEQLLARHAVETADAESRKLGEMPPIGLALDLDLLGVREADYYLRWADGGAGVWYWASNWVAGPTRLHAPDGLQREATRLLVRDRLGRRQGGAAVWLLKRLWLEAARRFRARTGW